jgi:putative ABC transport system permease protein
MTRVALNSIKGRRMRTALTAIAIVLGVAMISGAYTLTDTMRGGADSLSKSSYDGTDAAVVKKTAVKLDSMDDSGTRPPIAASTLQRVREVPGVKTAVGSITDEARIVKRNGKVAGSGPYFGIGYDAITRDSNKLAPFRVRTGHFATDPGQVVIDKGTADKNGLHVGDPVRIQTKGPAQTFHVTGIATFGDVNSIGTATFAVFDLRAAQTLFGKEGRFDEVLAAGNGSVSPAALRKRIGAALPPSVKVQTAKAEDRFTLDGLKQFVNIIQIILVAFGFVAVFVGAFTIFNTLSITVAQRSREFAMLRTIGASRRQVLRSVVVEALALGAMASVVGLVAGLGLAQLLQSVLKSSGLDLPQSGTVFAARTVVVSLLVGIVVTLLAGLGPALRATRVSPVTVLREGSEIPPSRIGRRAPAIAAVVSAIALAILGIGLFAGGIDATGRLALLAPGALLLFVGVALISPKLVPTLASVLGKPGQRIGGAAGKLARSNSMRNPGRTAVTAAALMIGIALVAFVAVIGQGMRDSTTGSLKKSVRADYVVVGQDGFSPIDSAATRAVAKVPGVRVATGLAEDRGKAFDKAISVDGVDPGRIAKVYGSEWKQGSDATLTQLGNGGAVVTDKFAKKHHLKVGQAMTLISPGSKRLALRIAGVSKPDKFNALSLGEVTIARSAFDGAFDAKRERYAFVKAGDGAGPALERALKPYPDAKLQTKSTFESDQSAWVDQILAIFYVLLALCVLVSLFGIVNTLALSVFERTRELGMLKAVGMTRRQVRRMIRHESIVTALIGAVLGIAVGLFLAALATTALSSEGLRFGLPVGSLMAFTVVAIVAGMLAAIFPARRAARLEPLKALQYE